MNKGRLVLGIGLIAIALAIFSVSSSANIEFLGMNYDDSDESRVTTTDNVPSIHSIKADGVVDVHISTSDTESVRYVFSDKRFKNKSTFKDGVLRINFPTRRKSLKLFGYSNSGVDVFVTVKTLNHVQMNGVGSIKNEGVLESEHLKIINEGTGNMNLNIQANKVNARNNGIGSLTISGNTSTATLSNQGVGSVDANELVAQVVEANNKGVGSMEVYAEEEIKLRNSGVGSLRYSGDAIVRSKSSDGIGSISKR